MRGRCFLTPLTGVLLAMAATSAHGQNGFVTRSGTQFMLAGRPAYFAGTNSYYQVTYRRWGAAGPDEVLDKMQARGLNLVRTWAFQDQAEIGACLQCAPNRQLTGAEKPTDFVDPATLVALDQTLVAADARGIRVILTLVNNWGDYGGIDRWTVWRYGAVHHDAFFSDTTLKNWYKQLVSLLVNRVNSVNGRLYRDDPTIFAWELTNEARSAPAAASALNAWMGEMSAYLKSLDPNHMVTTGIEGYYGPAFANRNTDAWMAGYGQDFITNHQHATIDFATCHIWPENWGWNPIGNPASALARATQYLQQRLMDSAGALGKPLLCEEFGIPRDNHGRGIGSGTTSIRDQFYSQVFQALCQESARTGGACGGTANWLILHDGYSQYDDGNGVFLPSDAATDALITAHATFMRRLRKGDLDFDGDVDQSDFGALQKCMSPSSGVVPNPACRNADIDNSSTVDAADVTAFSRCMNGPDVPADPNCVYDPPQ